MTDQPCPFGQCGHDAERHGESGCLEDDCYCRAPDYPDNPDSPTEHPIRKGRLGDPER